MRYRYLASSPQGQIQEGEMEAPSAHDVAEKLREKSLIPLEIKEIRPIRDFFRFKREKAEDLLLFTEQLYRLLRAGVPLDRALQILEKIFASSGKKELERLASSLQHELARGRKLSEALKNEKMFPHFYVNMIEAGELSGALEEVLKELASYLKERQAFQQELLSALLYPSFLLIFGLLAVQTVLVYVLPRFALIFEEMGVTPPLFTAMLIKLGIFWKNWGWLFLIGLILAFLYFRRYFILPEKRPALERKLLSVPFLGRVLLLADLARVFRGLAVMLKGGVTIERAFKLAAQIPGLYLLRESFSKLAEEVKHGESLAQLFATLPLKASFVLELVAIGEETGDLAGSFSDIANLCEEEVRLATKRFLTILEPATILFFGGLLGLIIVSILVAIFDLRLS